MGNGGDIDHYSEPKGLLFTRSEVVKEPLVTELASADDMNQVKRNPLLRACYSLECALAQSSELNVTTPTAETLQEQQPGIEQEDKTTYLAACLSLAFVSLSFRDFRRALDLSKRVLEETPTSSTSSSPAEGASTGTSTGTTPPPLAGG